MQRVWGNDYLVAGINHVTLGVVVDTCTSGLKRDYHMKDGKNREGGKNKNFRPRAVSLLKRAFGILPIVPL